MFLFKDTNGKDNESDEVDKLQENFQQLSVENNGIHEPPSPVAESDKQTTSPPYKGGEMLSPPMCYPTPPPSAEGSPLPAKEQTEGSKSGNLALQL